MPAEGGRLSPTVSGRKRTYARDVKRLVSSCLRDTSVEAVCEVHGLRMQESLDDRVRLVNGSALVDRRPLVAELARLCTEDSLGAVVGGLAFQRDRLAFVGEVAR